ncbi:amidohydrolase [Paraburkholderia fungorum]|uniref:Amidohydrolase n=1 Tax=Paraburkholderia fungorum TaxID=134537 RepID=A0A3R7ICU5_9BURK|nr:amidohydrolase family protein [Paraburkholderia fungorum]RKF50124.1 amidohydrolase [Paraburkholderia fungorum]
MAECIDAHQHFWDLSRGDYSWLTPALIPLYRSFGPADLAPLRAAAGVVRTVAVQAAPAVDETRYLLALAQQDVSIAGVVGWVPLLAADAPETLNELAQNAQFKGVRPMLQDMPNDNWITNPALAPAIDALIERDLAFDALIHTRHAAALAVFAARFPRLRIVVDHGAKPPISAGRDAWQQWAEAIARLAALPNLHCKLSGLAAGAGADWTPEILAPSVGHLLHCFGASRVMWGSDWPVVNLQANYGSWRAVSIELTASLGAAAQDAIFGGNAATFYQLRSTDAAFQGQ